MGQHELDAVVRDVYSKTYGLWETTRDRIAGDSDHGFKILYGPARFQPAVLIIGLQPGGSGSNMRDAELQQPSASNEYLSESWTLATELRERFGTEYLKGAIGTNAVFFRAPSWREWCCIDQALRSALTAFCVSQNKRLIEAIRPRQILVLGWDALDLMGGSGFRESVANKSADGRRRRKRLLMFGRIEAFLPSRSPIHPPHGRIRP